MNLQGCFDFILFNALAAGEFLFFLQLCTNYVNNNNHIPHQHLQLAVLFLMAVVGNLFVAVYFYMVEATGTVDS